MVGLFKSEPFVDPQLGTLQRSRGFWRGTISLGSGASAPLAVAGTRSAPDTSAMAATRDLIAQFPARRSEIERALFQHYEPYAEASAAGELDTQIPKISSPSQVWSNVSLVFVSVEPLESILTVELGYATGWDEEHTLGARFRAGAFLELCGSTLIP